MHGSRRGSCRLSRTPPVINSLQCDAARSSIYRSKMWFDVTVDVYIVQIGPKNSPCGYVLHYHHQNSFHLNNNPILIISIMWLVWSRWTLTIIIIINKYILHGVHWRTIYHWTNCLITITGTSLMNDKLWNEIVKL